MSVEIMGVNFVGMREKHPQYFTQGYAHWEIPLMFNFPSLLYSRDRQELRLSGLLIAMHQKRLVDKTIPCTTWEAYTWNASAMLLTR